MEFGVIDYIESWVEQWMDQRGGGDNWDWNNTNDTFSKYYDCYGLNIDTETSGYNISGRDTEKVNAYQTIYGPNDYESTFHFEHTYTDTDSFTWTLTESFSESVSTSAGVQVPDFFSAEVGTTFEISTTKAGSHTKEEATSWHQSADINVPAHHEVDISMIVTRHSAVASSTLDAVATGRVAAGLNSRWDGHYFWFLPIADLARQFNDDSAVSVQGNEVHFRIPLEFEGAGTVSSHIQVQRKDEDGNVVDENTKSHITNPMQLKKGADPET